MHKLSAEQWTHLSALLDASHSSELKVTVPFRKHARVTEALRLDPIDAIVRQVFFYDTPDLRLYDAGIVVRTRRTQGGGGDTALKLRPVSPMELPESFRDSENLKTEVDISPAAFVCSASMKAESTADDVREVHFGRRPLSSLLSEEQREFYSWYDAQGIHLDELEELGPILALKLKHDLPEFESKLTVEYWVFSDNQSILELSLKAPTSQALHLARDLGTYLAERGVDLDAEQHMKTKTALSVFARRHHHRGP